jgi:hypothetical protein
MRKSPQSKLKLNRETLVALEESAMRRTPGAADTLGYCSQLCGSTTIYASGCYSRCTCTTALC